MKTVMVNRKILIVDYGMGNLHSVKKKLIRLQINPIISSDPMEIEKAEKIILPGVGHFQKAMENLHKLNIFDSLKKVVIEKGIPILGICLGMQLMAKHSEEGHTNGLGFLDADVVRFKVKDKLKYKVPHTGWNQIIKAKESRLMQDIPEFSEFYFVHSYHFKCNNVQDVLNETDYEYRFVSAVEKDNVFGVQYHPEKSHDAGEKLLKNFVDL
jgi:glutamine amidotransferase